MFTSYLLVTLLCLSVCLSAVTHAESHTHTQPDLLLTPPSSSDVALIARDKLEGLPDERNLEALVFWYICDISARRLW